MSEVSRYLPLPRVDINITVPQGNVSYVSERVSAFYTLIKVFEPYVILVGILSIALLSAIAIIFLATVWYGRDVASFAKYLISIKKAMNQTHGGFVEYVYPGIKLILRKYYLKLREAIGCNRCTPRELVTKCGRVEYEEFVQLYEDVVYGSKELGSKGERVLVKLSDSV